MIINGDTDYRHALEVLTDRGKYNELDMLRAAYTLINKRFGLGSPRGGDK